MEDSRHLRIADIEFQQSQMANEVDDISFKMHHLAKRRDFLLRSINDLERERVLINKE